MNACIHAIWTDVSSPELHGIPEFQAVFYSSGRVLWYGDCSCRRTSSQGSWRQLWVMSENKTVTHLISDWSTVIIHLGWCFPTAELQVAARPWWFPLSSSPTEPSLCLRSAACWAGCRAAAACVCPVCIQSLKRQNMVTLDFPPINIFSFLGRQTVNNRLFLNYTLKKKNSL